MSPVKLKLSYKILTAFLLVTFISIGMMVAILRYLTTQNFEAYVHQREMENLTSLASALAEVHRADNGWDSLQKNRKAWQKLLGSVRPKNEPSAPDSAPGPPGSETDFRPAPAFRGPDGLAPAPDAADPGPNQVLPPRGPVADPLYIGPRMGLFDSAKKPVVGAKGDWKTFTLLPIKVDGKTVGWLGLRFGPQLTHPLDREYIQQQSRVMLFIGGLALVVAVIIALMLANHLLGPIKRLTEATGALSRLDFKARIPIKSDDELGDLAARFNLMAQRLEAYEHNQKQWLSDVSHELRTPLAVLGGEIEALQDGIREPDAGALSSLHEEVQHLSRIVNDLHDLSLAEAGVLPMLQIQVAPSQILAQTVEKFKPRFSRLDMAIEMDLNPFITGKNLKNLELTGDPDRLQQVFTNILENALKHADKPGKLSIRQRQSQGAWQVFFEDSGPGVAPDVLPHLFDRLFRADPSRSRSTGGSGLGLAICKTIVERHGGQISASNSPKGGLQIEISLPFPADGPVSSEHGGGDLS